MSYYYNETRKLTEITLPVNCEEWHLTYQPDFTGYQGIKLHNHEPLELIIMKSGTVIWTADTQTYQLSAGDILLFNPYVLHSTQWVTPDTEAVYFCITLTLKSVLGFRKSVLDQCAADVTEGKYRFDEFYPANDTDTGKIYSIANTMVEKFHQKTPASECEIMSCLYLLLTTLLESHYHEVPDFDTSQRNKQFLQKISLYLEENHQKPITSKDAAEALFLSPSWFSHVFHQHFGVSFPKYLCQYRVRRAAEYYANSTLPITEIATAVGFSDYCYFSRSFKKYIGKSPAVYFGRWKTLESVPQSNMN